MGDIFLFFAGFLSLGAQRIAGQREAVIALHEAVEDGIGKGGIADPGMPMLNRRWKKMRIAKKEGRNRICTDTEALRRGVSGFKPTLE